MEKLTRRLFGILSALNLGGTAGFRNSADFVSPLLAHSV
jgi:hypothetical protein